MSKSPSKRPPARQGDNQTRPPARQGGYQSQSPNRQSGRVPTNRPRSVEPRRGGLSSTLLGVILGMLVAGGILGAYILGTSSRSGPATQPSTTGGDQSAAPPAQAQPTTDPANAPP